MTSIEPQYTGEAGSVYGTKFSGDRFIKFVLPATFYPRISEDRYAVIMMPSTYADAQRAASTVFGRMLGINVVPDNITLRIRIKNEEGISCWADIIRDDWANIIQYMPVKEVGVFNIDQHNTILGPTVDWFMVSPIHRPDRNRNTTIYDVLNKVELYSIMLVFWLGLIPIAFLLMLGMMTGKK